MTNRLALETSPYLQQHAGNPVDWYPWGEEALEKARRENKPILLSIGYSACHWCHVMEHESFENKVTADLMNELFINIKVDREERPDLDKIYQLSHQMLTQRSGGWPLNMFLTPNDHMPIFGGTYFPPDSRHGMPAFTEILRKVSGFYINQPQEIQRQSDSIGDVFRHLETGIDEIQKQEFSILDKSFRSQVESQFDREYGGFGKAPKFFHSATLNYCLDRWAMGDLDGDDNEAMSHTVEHTLTTMAHSGIFDQLAGGFFRYSVDEKWTIPHFEKMLYDNALLLSLYADSYLTSGNDLYKSIVSQIADWVKTDMQSPEGGYYSTLDADSEGEEGRYYAWDEEEIKTLLQEEQYQILEQLYGFNDKHNFEGRWHLHRAINLQKVADGLSITLEEAEHRLQAAHQKLLEHRKTRQRPGRDEKILCSWNALMITGMTRAGRILDEPSLVESAESALEFLKSRLWKDGRLLASHKDGVSRHAAYLDDYAYLMDAVLELLQCRWSNEDLVFLTELAKILLNHFQDPRGGFFFTADDHETLVHRPKSDHDDAIPSGNGIAAQALLKLGYLLADSKYIEAALGTIKAMSLSPQAALTSQASVMSAFALDESKPEIIILRGNAETLKQWQECAQASYAPHRLVFSIPSDTKDLHSSLKDKKPIDETTAYICRGSSCQAAITDYSDYEQRLNSI